MRKHGTTHKPDPYIYVIAALINFKRAKDWTTLIFPNVTYENERVYHKSII